MSIDWTNTELFETKRSNEDVSIYVFDKFRDMWSMFWYAKVATCSFKNVSNRVTRWNESYRAFGLPNTILEASWPISLKIITLQRGQVSADVGGELTAS